MRESDIQKEIVDYLRKMGHTVVRVHLGGISRFKGGKKIVTRNPMKGWPDLQVIHGSIANTMFFVECKSSSGRLSEDQKKWQDLLLASGFLYIVATSVKEVFEGLESMDL